MKKLIMRIFITISMVLLIFLGINKILKIKHKDKIINEKNSEWNWTMENDLIWQMLNDKYPLEGTKDYPLVMLRNYDIPKKEDNEKRILIVGDSFVYGYGGTNVNYTWWKQLNLKIKEAGYSNVNIYGAGKYAFNTKDELEKILKNDSLIKRIDPDLIIICYVSNDPEERDSVSGRNIVKDIWEIVPEENEVYKKSPTLYYELVDRMNALGDNEYDKLVEIGNVLGYYRWDARCLYIVKGENLSKYEKILKDVDDKIKTLGIPYFYFFTDNIDNPMVTEANNIVLNSMKKLNIEAYYPEFNSKKMLESINSSNMQDLAVNPVDSHPGITWSYEYGIKAFEILKKDYNFIFEISKQEDINELEININDTMPFLNVKKVNKNIFEFEYPKSESERTVESQFLYYPIEREYVKLNLEYPKNISKIIIKGENIKDIDLYVNTIDKEYGYDINEVFRKLTKCENLENNTYKIEQKITSLNISVLFNSENNRNLRIEFIE